MSKKPLSRKRSLFFMIREVDREIDKMEKAWSLAYGKPNRDTGQSLTYPKRSPKSRKSTGHRTGEAGTTALEAAEEEIKASTAGGS